MREDVRDFSMSRLLAKTSRVARSALKIGKVVSLLSCHQQLRVWIPEIQLHDEHSLLRMGCDEMRDDKWSSHIQMSIQESKALTAKGCL